eukprot:1150633-Pelagomonas_calceolata.AAC.9
MGAKWLLSPTHPYMQVLQEASMLLTKLRAHNEASTHAGQGRLKDSKNKRAMLLIGPLVPQGMCGKERERHKQIPLLHQRLELNQPDSNREAVGLLQGMQTT